MTERELQNATIETAHLFGWTCAHFRPALSRSGRWMTPVAADGAGWPDLFLVRKGVAMAVELKSDTGRVTREQQRWLDLLGEAGVETHVWLPEDWTSGRIEECLR